MFLFSLNACTVSQADAIARLPEGIEERGKELFQGIIDWALFVMNLPEAGVDWSDTTVQLVLGDPRCVQLQCLERWPLPLMPPRLLLPTPQPQNAPHQHDDHQPLKWFVF